MKQRSTKSLLSMFTKNEIDVAAILLELPELIAESESRLRTRFSWGAKRRRSADENAQLSLLSSSAAVPSPARPIVKSETSTVKVEASSPATPLAFPGSESDESPKRLKKEVSVKKEREDRLGIMDQCTQSNELLETLSLGIRRERPNLETSENLNTEMRLGQAMGSQDHQQQKPSFLVNQATLIMDQKAIKQEVNGNYLLQCGETLSSWPHNSGSCMISDNVGPLGIPDLNVSVWIDSNSIHLLDSKNLRRVMTAQARKKRLQILRSKRSNASSKSRFSCRR